MLLAYRQTLGFFDVRVAGFLRSLALFEAPFEEERAFFLTKRPPRPLKKPEIAPKFSDKSSWAARSRFWRADLWLDLVLWP